MEVKFLHEDAKLPMRGSEQAAGLDLFTIENAIISPGCRALLKTGIAVALKPGTAGLIWPRSKLAAKLGIVVLAGVVDSDYRGEVMVSLLNTGNKDVELMKGDKVAQLIVQPVLRDSLKVVDNLSDTERGVDGVLSSEMRIR